MFLVYWGREYSLQVSIHREDTADSHSFNLVEGSQNVEECRRCR